MGTGSPRVRLAQPSLSPRRGSERLRSRRDAWLGRRQTSAGQGAGGRTGQGTMVLELPEPLLPSHKVLFQGAWQWLAAELS